MPEIEGVVFGTPAGALPMELLVLAFRTWQIAISSARLPQVHLHETESAVAKIVVFVAHTGGRRLAAWG
jgi:hypothetical protein